MLVSVQRCNAARVQRLKDARAEAQKEIEVLKAEKNKEFSGFEQKFSGSNDDSFTKVNAETDQKIVEIDAAYKKNKDLVIERMLAGLVNVEPKVHINVRSA
ncbi:H(+)-transporting V1 sector ATPase subunit G [Rhizoclosmatium sp. JEL0117]|nr:H(+)-transporting V1 sector ATPase subunit G [Rhizoclosmatium hyalinum]KAJ3297536.1 H(+)-transporting V1 sector ATPase subunit G [Rhizoclosmatium sp. JEL0117]